jgi:plasmid maintenance system antidote protein VapI
LAGIWSEPDFWMNLQKLYELDIARQEIGEQLAEIPRRLSNEVPRPTLPQ